MIRTSRVFVLLAASSLVLGACKKKPPAPAPAPVQENRPAPTPERPAATTPTNTGDNGAVAAAALAAARTEVANTIYFELDADELTDASKALLDKKIQIMNKNAGVRVRIAGHCDDRGSDEYNIALGRRRAEAAKRYLTDRGIDASRVETTTFGRERPKVQGSGEDAWSQNRRDEFEIISGEIRTP